MAVGEIFKFDTGNDLAKTLAETIAKLLQAAVEERGRATLAVSGGSTPIALFKQLAQQEIDWTHVTVTIVDDRWVKADHPRSNERLVRENLLQHHARPAHLVPLVADAACPETGLKEVETSLEALASPLDVVVLGMGDDGHTASFFPSGDNLTTAVLPNAPNLVSTMRAPGAKEPRITLTLPPIATARTLFLHIEGANKLQVFEKARGEGDADLMPIRHILRHKDTQIQVYWAQ